ncbi:hypothetical protein HMPREF0043_00102 [Actinobaculum sp. oral taxon 183 str. F0552]|nr:hypothetical protein HMPREF0043_00102 [Actinobaculum sp. oral taxon 183 str. F0552]
MAGIVISFRRRRAGGSLPLGEAHRRYQYDSYFLRSRNPRVHGGRDRRAAMPR